MTPLFIRNKHNNDHLKLPKASNAEGERDSKKNTFFGDEILQGEARMPQAGVQNDDIASTEAMVA